MLHCRWETARGHYKGGLQGPPRTLWRLSSHPLNAWTWKRTWTSGHWNRVNVSSCVRGVKSPGTWAALTAERRVIRPRTWNCTLSFAVTLSRQVAFAVAFGVSLKGLKLSGGIRFYGQSPCLHWYLHFGHLADVFVQSDVIKKNILLSEQPIGKWYRSQSQRISMLIKPSEHFIRLWRYQTWTSWSSIHLAFCDLISIKPHMLSSHHFIFPSWFISTNIKYDKLQCYFPAFSDEKNNALSTAIPSVAWGCIQRTFSEHFKNFRRIQGYFQSTGEHPRRSITNHQHFCIAWQHGAFSSRLHFQYQNNVYAN